MGQPETNPRAPGKETLMLWNVAVLLIFLWLLGFVNHYTMGGFIHILPVIAVFSVLVGILQSRRITQPSEDRKTE
jgi:hypothetical protein